MEQLNGIWVKTGILRLSLKSCLQSFKAQTLTEDYSTLFEITCQGKCEQVCFSKSIQTRVSVFDQLLYFCRFVLVAHIAKLADEFWAANLHRRVPVWVKGWYARWEKPKADSTSALTASGFECYRIQTNTKQRVKHISMQSQRRYCTLWRTWTGTTTRLIAEEGKTSTRIFFLSCFLLFFPSFFVYYGMSCLSSTYPQEALHSLIICTSNQGRHRDADYKSRPPPHHCGVIVLQQLPLIGAVGLNC